MARAVPPSSSPHSPLRRALLLAPLAVLSTGCPLPPPAGGDGGIHEQADAGPRDGGGPSSPPCREEGIPCRRAEVPADAQARAAAILAEVDARWEAGDAFDDIQAFVQAHDDVAEVGTTTGAFFFRVEDGRPRWVLDPSRRAEDPQTDASGQSANEKAVVEHPDAADTDHHGEHKRALFIDPFRWQMRSEQEVLMAKLEQTRDYGRAGAVERRVQAPGDVERVGPDAFEGWREYDLVMVTSHGASAVPEEGGAVRDVVFSSLDCQDQGPLTEDDGFPQPGLSCSRMLLAVEGQDGVKRRQIAQVVSMDESFFAAAYPQGLRSQLLILDACQSASISFGGQGAVLAWTDTIKIEKSIATMDAVFELLIDDGLPVFDAMAELAQRGLDSYSQANGANPRLSPSGADFLRAREFVHLVDPATGGVITDTALATFSGDQPRGGTTTFLLDMKIDGVQPQLGYPYTVTLYDDDDDTVLAGPLEVPVAGAAEGELLREGIEVRLPRELQTTEELRLRAEAELPTPYDGPSTHTTTVFVEPPPDEGWTFTFDQTYGGPGILAPTAQSAPNEDGDLVWTLHLDQGEGDPSALPLGDLVLIGHGGRSQECTGATGTFPVSLTVSTTSALYGVEDGTIDITRFDDVAFEATLTGSAEKLDLTDPEAEPVPVPFSGSIQWPESGCTDQPEDPGEEELFGHYTTASEPDVCIEVWAGNIAFPDAESFQQTCEMGDELICADGECPAASRLGRCDFRQEGAQESFAGTVQAYYAGIDVSLADLEQGCVLQGGIWIAEDGA